MAITLTIPDPTSAQVWRCPDCEAIVEEEPEFHKLYECQECGDKFTDENGGGRNGNMCPSCGNKFGTRVDDKNMVKGRDIGNTICPECNEGVCEEGTQEQCPECSEALEEEGDTDAYIKHYVAEHDVEYTQA